MFNMLGAIVSLLHRRLMGAVELSVPADYSAYVQTQLEKHGVRLYWRQLVGDTMFFNVSEEQADQAESILEWLGIWHGRSGHV